MPTAIERVRTDLDSTLAQAEEFTNREDFNADDPAYLALRSRAEELTVGYRELVEWENRRAESDRIGASLRGAESRQESRHSREDAETLTPGEEFIRSDVFNLYAQRGSTPRFTIPDGLALLTRALPMNTAGWADAIATPPPRDISAPVAPTPLLDLIPAIPWSSDVVNYVTFAKTAGGAANVAEGAAKPSGEWAPTASTDQMVKIAVYTQATRELLENGPAVRTKVDSLLTNDVRRQAEANAAAALAAAVVPAVTGEHLLGAIRTAMGTVQAAGYAPNAVLLHPSDWAAMDVDVFYQSQYGTVVNQSFWGLRPVASLSQPAGTATVGDFGSAMERYVRSAIQVYITDSHANTFVENVFTILAETRELSAVIRPAALCDASVTAEPPAARSRKAA